MIRLGGWQDVGSFRRWTNADDARDFIIGIGVRDGKIRPASFEALKKDWQARDWLIQFRAKIGDGLG